MIRYAFILVYGVIILSGCAKEEPSSCDKFLSHPSSKGHSHIEGNYTRFTEFAEFATLGIQNNGDISMTFFSVDKRCYQDMYIAFDNLPYKIKINDTIFIKYSYLGLSNDFPTGIFTIDDYDAEIESYDILEENDNSNWIVIESINNDTTEISGKFQASFITTYEPYLNGERERWDDPNRPDTLRFTNGEFRAVSYSY